MLWLLRARDTDFLVCAQIPWSDEFDHETGRELFGSNLLALTWIKGEPMPSGLVDDVLRGLGIERTEDTQGRERRSMRRSLRQGGLAGGSSGMSSHSGSEGS